MEKLSLSEAIVELYNYGEKTSPILEWYRVGGRTFRRTLFKGNFYIDCSVIDIIEHNKYTKRGNLYTKVRICDETQEAILIIWGREVNRKNLEIFMREQIPIHIRIIEPIRPYDNYIKKWGFHLWAHERFTKIIDLNKFNFKLKEYCEMLGIHNLYYIVDVQNLEAILKRGILSYNQVEALKIPHVSFADDNIQRRRSQIKINGLSAHDYVPLFFHPKTPMLYRLQCEYSQKFRQNEIIIICVSNEVLSLPGVHFTDRNLASNSCKIFKEIEDLKKLNWSIIRDDFIRWKLNSEVKAIKGAEVLVPQRVDPRFFDKIILYDNHIMEFLKIKFPKLNIPLGVRRDCYFEVEW